MVDNLPQTTELLRDTNLKEGIRLVENPSALIAHVFSDRDRTEYLLEMNEKVFLATIEKDLRKTWALTKAHHLTLWQGGINTDPSVRNDRLSYGENGAKQTFRDEDVLLKALRKGLLQDRNMGVHYQLIDKRPEGRS